MSTHLSWTSRSEGSDSSKGGHKMIAISEGYFSTGGAPLIAQFWHEIIAISLIRVIFHRTCGPAPFDGAHQDSGNNEQGLKSSGQGLVKPFFARIFREQPIQRG